MRWGGWGSGRLGLWSRGRMVLDEVSGKREKARVKLEVVFA